MTNQIAAFNLALVILSFLLLCPLNLVSEKDGGTHPLLQETKQPDLWHSEQTPGQQ